MAIRELWHHNYEALTYDLDLETSFSLVHPTLRSLTCSFLSPRTTQDIQSVIHGL